MQLLGLLFLQLDVPAPEKAGVINHYFQNLSEGGKCSRKDASRSGQERLGVPGVGEGVGILIELL